MKTLTSATALLAALVSMTGCSDAGKPYVPARGQVLVGGKPAEGVLVTLVPTSGDDDPGARPAGTVAADGSFSVASYDAAARKSHPGAPPGEYKVVLTWFPPAGLGTLDPNVAQVDKLGGRYRDPARSQFRVVVKETPTEFEPIRLNDAAKP